MATGRRRPAKKSGRLLPSQGRKEPAPPCPYSLSEAGEAWWEWAWHTPQAAAWTEGDLYTVAQRAFLEDVLIVSGADKAPAIIGQLGRLDDTLGLSPKGMKSLGWSVDASTETVDADSEMEVVQLDNFRAGLTG